MTEMEKLFVYFLEHRERARMWKFQTCLSRDPIISTYRFCNVRRRDDRVSEWLLKNVYKNSRFKHSDPALVAFLCRTINWPPSLAYLIEEDALFYTAENYDAEKVAELLEWHHQYRGKTITGAYVVLLGHRSDGKMRDISYTAKDVASHMPVIKKALSTNSIYASIDALTDVRGIGDFMGGQIVADLTYYPGMLYKATDLYTYAPMGPGSKRGLNRLFERGLNTRWKLNDFLKGLIYAREELALPELDQLKPETITLHDIQNCMCEFDKFCRVKFGEGKPRSLYESHDIYYNV